MGDPVTAGGGFAAYILQLRPHYTVHAGGWRMALIEFQVFFKDIFENIVEVLQKMSSISNLSIF